MYTIRVVGVASVPVPDRVPTYEYEPRKIFDRNEPAVSPATYRLNRPITGDFIIDTSLRYFYIHDRVRWLPARARVRRVSRPKRRKKSPPGHRCRTSVDIFLPTV